MGVRHQQVADGVLLARDHGQLALAAAALLTERADLLALDIAALAEVTTTSSAATRSSAVSSRLASAWMRVLRSSPYPLQLAELVLDDLQDLARVGEQVLQGRSAG